MNALGNRQIGGNLRILLLNNGTGTEFKQYGSVSESFGNDFDKFVAAAGHFGSKSKTLVKHFSQDLGFEYMTASSKEEFNAVYTKFLNPEVGDKSLIFKVFT